jgi:hypothetical protein
MFYYWEPKGLKIASGEVPPLFSGKIKIRAPKYVEKLEYTKIMSKFKDVKFSELTKDSIENIKEFLDIAKKHIVEVDLKRNEDGFEIKDIESMEYDQDLAIVLLNVASSLVEERQLGKSLMKS